MAGQELIQGLDPRERGGINQIGQVLLPHQVSAKNHLRIGDDDHGISTRMPQHVTDLHQPGAKVEVYSIAIDHIRQDQRLDHGSVLGLGVFAEELQVLGALPGAQIAVGQNGSARFSKGGITAGMVKVVMGVDHITDRLIRGDFVDLVQQGPGWSSVLEGIDNDHAVAAHNKSGIAARLAAIAADRGINTFANFLDREIRIVSAERVK